MSHDDSTPPSRDETTITVTKSEVEGLISGRFETGLDGEWLWPIEPRNLATLYRASAEHGRAIHIKAEGAFGGGLIGGDADKLRAVCDGGATALFTHLDLDLNTYGNGFLQVIRSTDGARIVSLRRLPAITMSRHRGGYLQRVTKPDGKTKKVSFTADEVVHLREPCPEGLAYALPSWIGAAGMLELAHAATRYNASFFANNAIPEYAITFKGVTPTQVQKDAIREFFRNDFRGLDNQHRTLILMAGEDGEVKIERLTAEVKDGDFLKLLDASRDRLPVAHGVPPRMLGIMSAGQLGGGGEVRGQLFTFEHLTLMPRRRNMLDQLASVLAELGLKPHEGDGPPEAGEVAFRPLNLTPPSDPAPALPNLVASGVLSPDEARALIPQLIAAEGAAEPRQEPIARSAGDGSIAALAALLARF